MGAFSLSILFKYVLKYDVSSVYLVGPSFNPVSTYDVERTSEQHAVLVVGSSLENAMGNSKKRKRVTAVFERIGP